MSVRRFGSSQPAAWTTTSRSRLSDAIEILRDELRAFPGTEFDAMLREAAKLRADSPKGVAGVSRFLREWCDEDYFGKDCYRYDSSGRTPSKDVAFDRIDKAASVVSDCRDSLLNVEVEDLDAGDLDFLIACIDEGCVPPLVYGCGKGALLDLRKALVRQRSAM